MDDKKTYKVLIVDDSMLTRRLIKEIISPLNFEIDFAVNGQTALEKLENQNYDLLLLDLLMPDITGIEVLEELQKKGKKLPVIVVSADIQETTRKKCLELGAIDVVGKPPKQEVLLDLIKKTLV